MPVISEQDKLMAVISLSTLIIIKKKNPSYQRIIFWPPIYSEGSALWTSLTSRSWTAFYYPGICPVKGLRKSALPHTEKETLWKHCPFCTLPDLWSLACKRCKARSSFSPSLSPSWCNAGVLGSQLFPLHSASHGDVSYNRRQAARSAWGLLWHSPLSAVLLAFPVHLPLTTNKQTVQHARVSCFTAADLACILTSDL